MLKKSVKKLVLEEAGATSVEYGIMASLIAAVVIGAVAILGINVNGLFQFVASVLP
jgi:pilus assembly protein Flp/PilA